MDFICRKCGSNNQEDSVFCSKCGTLLKENETKTKGKKIIIPVLIAIIFLVALGTTYLLIQPPSAEKVYNKIKNYEDIDDAIDYLNKVYPNDGGFLGLFKKNNAQNKIEVLDLLMKDIEDKFRRIYGGNIKDYID